MTARNVLAIAGALIVLLFTPYLFLAPALGMLLVVWALTRPAKPRTDLEVALTSAYKAHHSVAPPPPGEGTIVSRYAAELARQAGK
jgi:hypothetical protein